MANLTQLKMLEELNGFLLVDKPSGLAFSTVVKTVKRKFNLVKVGHGGSLDALASGLLVLLINDANKFVDRVMGADREWEGTLRFGETTDTGDVHGRPMALPERLATIDDFRGDVFQTEPRYSSIRREGRADWEIADTGDHPQFLTHVYRMTVENGNFQMLTGKAFLPRAMAQDLGATLTALRRTKIGKLDVKDSIAFDRLLDTEIKDFAACVMPLSQALQ